VMGLALAFQTPKGFSIARYSLQILTMIIMPGSITILNVIYQYVSAMKLEWIMEDCVSLDKGIMIFGLEVYQASISLLVGKILCTMNPDIKIIRRRIFSIYMYLLKGLASWWLLYSEYYAFNE